MRPIKFRGRTFDGKIVYGYYVPQCPMSSFPGIVDDEEFIYEVEPESIEQLIAVDKNHNDVYEGDLVIHDCAIDEFPFPATFDNYRAIVDGEVVLYKGDSDDETD